MQSLMGFILVSAPLYRIRKGTVLSSSQDKEQIWDLKTISHDESQSSTHTHASTHTHYICIYIIIYIHRYTVSVAVVQLVFPILDSARQSNYPWYATCRHAVDTIFASIGKNAYSPHLVWMEEPLSNYVCSDWLSSQHFPFNQSICSYEPVASYHMFVCWFVIFYFHISWS